MNVLKFYSLTENQLHFGDNIRTDFQTLVSTFKRMNRHTFCSVKMDLQVTFKKQLNQIEKLDNFCSLYGNKEQILTDLCDILSQTKDIRVLLQTCGKILKEIQVENYKKLKTMIEYSRKQQTMFLDILENFHCLTELRDCSDFIPNSKEHENCSVLKEISNSPKSRKLQLFKSAEHPILTSLANYIKSPYATRRMRPLSLQFIDFEKQICMEEFMQIPG